MVNRIDRCTMEILIFSDKSLSLKVKLYNENSRFRKRNQPLSKLFPSNVQKISKFYLDRTDRHTDWTEFSEEKKLAKSSQFLQNLILNLKSAVFMTIWILGLSALSAQWIFHDRNFSDSKKWSITFLCFRVQLIWQFLRRMNFFLTCSYSRFQILSHLFPKHHTVSCQLPLNYPTLMGCIENQNEFEVFWLEKFER